MGLDWDVQGVVEGIIQLLGFAALQLVTLGRYGRIRPTDPVLLEGGVGFALVAAAAVIFYRGVL